MCPGWTLKRMARPVRFELTTYSFGGCRSIHLSYGRPVSVSKKEESRNAYTQKLQRLFNFNPCALSAPQSILAALSPHRPPRVQPLARVLMSCASFSISSAFFTISIDRTFEESVFSTSAFKSVTSAYSFSMFFLMSFSFASSIIFVGDFPVSGLVSSAFCSEGSGGGWGRPCGRACASRVPVRATASVPAPARSAKNLRLVSDIATSPRFRLKIVAPASGGHPRSSNVILSFPKKR